MEKNKPKDKKFKGQLSVALFEQVHEDGKLSEFYSVQRSRKVNNEWKNENIIVSKEQLGDLRELISQALGGEVAQ